MAWPEHVTWPPTEKHVAKFVAMPTIQPSLKSKRRVRAHARMFPSTVTVARARALLYHVA